MLTKTMEEVVKSHLMFLGVKNGWHTIYCEVCGDGKRTKGPRGGWRFEGTRAFYHCFNSGCNGNFDSEREVPFSKEMKNVLDKFGIPANEYMSTIPLKRNGLTKPVLVENKIKELIVPDFFMSMDDASLDDPTRIEAKKFLKQKYDLAITDYTFYMSTGISNGDIQQKLLAKSLQGRIIIPYFRNEKLIFWQARALDENAKMPYINADTPRSNVIFGFDKLHTNTDSPLYITEGVFDAINVNGVGVLENNLTSQQIAILNKSQRTKVVIPDYKGDSNKLAEQAIELGWCVALPDIGNCKDVSESIVKYGRMYTFDQIANNICSGRTAQMQLHLKLRKK